MGVAKRQMMEDDGFTSFLQEIVNTEAVEGAALGIAKLVIDQGRDVLSPRQEYVLKSQILDEYVTDGCQCCGGDIPWSEMMHAYDNGGMCGHCHYVMNKDD